MLWRNVYIECDDYCHEQLVGFLMDRPAIHTGIKSLKISISVESENPQTRNRNLANFYNFCSYLTANLTLDNLHVYLHFNSENVDQIAKCKGKFAFLATMRKVKVKHSFRLNGLMYVDEEKYGKPTSRFMIQIMVKLTNGLKPYSLLEPKPTTEQEGYLQERKELVHRFRKHERRMSRCARVSV